MGKKFCYWCESELPKNIKINRLVAVNSDTFKYVKSVILLSSLPHDAVVICEKCGMETSICSIDDLLSKKTRKTDEDEDESPFRKFETY